MKALKLGLTLIAAAILFTTVVSLPKKLAFDCGDSYTFFVGDTSKNCQVITVTQAAELKKLTLRGICGEATTYSTLNVDEFLKSVNGEILFTESLSDSENYYCHADLPYSINLYNQTVNLHICVKQSGVTVASPIIFGGY
ncbi:MAG: hypothetical protein ACI4MH_01465 [Candidatus Coproplasma sp.]